MKKIMCFVSFAVMALMSVSCSNEEIDNVNPPTNERVPNYAIMQFNGSKPSFDDDGITRGATDSWEDESKIYLQFQVGSNRVDGVAVYSKSKQEWAIQYYGELTTTNNGTCEAYYFEKAGVSDYKSVTLDYNTAIYFDKSATYAFENNNVTVSANLKPMTGRLRMKGYANQDFFMDGITFYNSYNIEDNSFTSINRSLFSSTNNDIYSDYIYGYFADNANKEVIINDQANNVSFIKKLGSNALAIGKSGYLDIPTLEQRSGWSTIRFKDYTVGKVTFRMIRVIGNATQSSFYIGETEVTQGLWNAVMSTNLTGGDNLPVVNVSYDDCCTFISRLNTKLNANFRLPTADEWTFAAKGGNLTHNWNYSGSNSWSDVAWCSSNSGGARHEVKTLKANEIGIYDMSGNVGEFVLHTSTTNGNYFYYGGTYGFGYSSCYCTDYSTFSDKSSTSNYVGLRLYIY